MYIKDGSQQPYGGKTRYESLYMWGWLGDKVKTKGWKDQKLKNRVVSLLKKMNACDYYMGHHDCPFCLEENRENKDSMGFNGSVYIEHEGITYCSPFGAEHYIEDHDYRPSDVVIDAILNGLVGDPRKFKKTPLPIDPTKSSPVRVPQKVVRKHINMPKEEKKTRWEKFKEGTLKLTPWG